MKYPEGKIQIVRITDPDTGEVIEVLMTNEFARAMLEQWATIQRGAIHLPPNYKTDKPHWLGKLETKSTETKA